MTDRELLEQAKRGSEDAFAQLVLDNQNRVYSLALRLTGDREEAADLAQEAFVRAWQGLPGFQGESSFSTWLYRLTTNVCIDYLRRQKRREGVERPAPLEDGEGTRIEPADWSQEPHRQLEQRERERIEQTLTQLQAWNVDCVGLCRRTGLKRPSQWAEQKQNWDTIFPGLAADIQVHAKIEGGVL